MSVATNCPKTTHQWLQPLYRWLDNTVLPIIQGQVGGGLLKMTGTLNFADFSGIASGATTYIKAIGTPLPSGARIESMNIGEGAFTGFWDATNGGFGLELGYSAAPNQIGASLSVATNTALSMPAQVPAGSQGYPGAPQGGRQLTARLTTSKSLSMATAGNVVINIFYSVE